MIPAPLLYSPYVSITHPLLLQTLPLCHARTDGIVIDESLDVMAWALSHKDPDNWLRDAGLTDPLIRRCDDEFKYWLDRYKYAVRFPEHTEAEQRLSTRMLTAVDSY